MEEADRFSTWLLRIGEGREPMYDNGVVNDLIRIPEEMAVDSVDQLLVKVFPDLSNEKLFANRAILTPRNEDAEEVNRVVVERIAGSLTEYKSIDSVAVEDGTCYPTEFLNTLTQSGMPPHLLRLKVGSPIIMLRNLNADDGLCNGTRLICRAFTTHVIEAQIVSGAFAGRRVFIPRIELTPSDSGLPFTLRRRQFPVRLCYCMTINKAQSQTLECVGLHLPTPAFSHGQLYVGLSRAGSADRIFVYAPSKPGTSTDVDGVFTRNIVYTEVLSAS